MDITLAGGAVTYEPNDDQLGRVSLEFAAFDGEVGVGQLPVPDSAAALTVADGRSARVNEIATRLTDGFILDQDRVRGPQPAGTAREHVFSVQDANALLDGFRVRRSRSAETDVARVLAFAALDGPSWDTTWVVVANTVTMSAKTYDSDGGWTSELIPDLVETSGKTLFLHDKANGGRCLHYHNLTSGHTCGLTISDVPSAVNGTTVFAPGQPTRNRTSVDLRNDIKGYDQGGRTSIVTDATSIATHDADGLQHQALISLEATSQADLDVKTAAYLASFKDERDTWTCNIGPLDATALSLIRVGDLITTTSSVMGLTASPQRIAHMTLSVWNGGAGTAPGLWQAALELGAPIRRRARVRNKAKTDRETHPPIPLPGSCQQVPSTGWEDGTAESGWPPVLDGWTQNHTNTAMEAIPGVSPPGGYTFDYTVERDILTPVPFDSSNVFHLWADLYWPAVTGTLTSAFNAVPAAAYFGAQMTLLEDPDNGFVQMGFNAAADVNDDIREVSIGGDIETWNANFGWWHIHIRVDASTSNTNFWQTGAEPTGWMLTGAHALTTFTRIRFNMTAGAFDHAFVESAFFYDLKNIVICTGDNGVGAAPVAFHWTAYGPVAPQEAADGVTTLFTLPAYPGTGYVAGTLTVFVDGVAQDKSETDPDAGTFTLPWAPATGDAITASWLVP